MAAEKYGGNKLLCHVAKTSFGRWNYKIGIECGRVVQQRGCKENKNIRKKLVNNKQKFVTTNKLK